MQTLPMPSGSSKHDRVCGLFGALRQLFCCLTPSALGVDDLIVPPGAPDLASNKLKASLKALDRGLNIIPSLKLVVDVLTDCIDNIPLAAKNRKDYEELAFNISISLKGLEGHLDQLSLADMTEALADVVEELKKQAYRIKEKQGRGEIEKYIYAQQDIDDLMRSYRRVEALFRQLESDAILNVWKVANENLVVVNENLSNIRLGRLDPVQRARYDSNAASQLRRGGCTPNTRELVLQGLQGWASDPYGAKVYWMNGMAGTGKTTIAYSLCHQLESANQLAASFFCSRSLPDCRDVTRVAPTIAYQLARFCRPFQDVLSRVLGNDPDIGTRGVAIQFERLVRDPLQEIKDTLPSGLLVVVIDALDECSERLDALLVLDALLHFAEDLPIKFFVTCRPDSSLLKMMSTGGGVSRSLYHLHDIEQSLVQADIETFLTVELEPVPATADEIKRLAEQSGKLFIHAATIVRYIGAQNPSIDPQRRLKVMLGITSHPSRRAYEPLDVLYGTILSAALGDTELESWEKDIIRLVLDTVVCAREPLTLAALAYLLRLEDSGQVQRALENLRSVVHMDERSGLVSTLHASFPDYMHSSARSGQFFCDEAKQSKILGQRCFETMKELLRFNICNFESSFAVDEDIPDLPSRIDNAIPSHLFYSCRYWSDHLTIAADGGELLVLLDYFLSHQVLFWIEVMNLKKSMRAGGPMLSKAYAWIKSSTTEKNLGVVCQDAQKLVQVVGANPVCRSTPHIYISVLALWERKDPMWAHYGTRMQGLVNAYGSAIDNRDPGALAAWRASNAIMSVAVSHDSNRVASGARDGTICIWDAHSGDVLAGPFQGHSEQIFSVVFSPDGGRVASASDDRTISVWDAQTGRIVGGPFIGHTGWVRSVSFSSDGQRIASGSYDCTIRIWDARTGHTVLGPFEGHSKGINSVAYSPGGDNLVSGSVDCTLRIWDAHNGRLLLGPLEGHTDSVRSVTYSPDGGRIASGSDDRTIRVWDALTGNALAGPFEGHTGWVYSVAFSPEGGRISSGAHDCTIRIWDAQNGQTVAGPLTAHTNPVFSVVFMPEGDRILSGSSDYTIRIWNAQTKPTGSGSSEGHTHEVYSIGFSPDSSRLVSGSEDCTICVWDTQTWGRKAGPFKGHNATVTSVAFSPGSDRIVSGSADRTVRIWDARAGDTLVGPLEGHTDEINSVAFSPDSERIASGSNDQTIRVWDARTGHLIAEPFRGHTGQVRSVAYSPNARHIVSGSSDRTIRIWDAQTGDALAEPFKGHTSSVWSVSYSSDGNRILSSSDDHTIRIWDAQTRQTVGGPLTEHTDMVRSARFFPDNSCIVSGSDDNTIRVWGVETGQTIAGPFMAHTDWVLSVSFSPDGHYIASSSSDCAIRIWDLVSCYSITAQKAESWAVNEDGWVVGPDSSLLLWVPADLRTGLKWLQNIKVIHHRGSFELDFSKAFIGSRWRECYISE